MPPETLSIKIKPGKPEIIVAAILCTVTIIEFILLSIFGY
jgi:hypothetical protein